MSLPYAAGSVAGAVAGAVAGKPAGGEPAGGGTAPRVVALGGGHGLAASLSALRRITGQVTAIVTVADNGGSSGRLRQEFGVLDRKSVV